MKAVRGCGAGCAPCCSAKGMRRRSATRSRTPSTRPRTSRSSAATFRRPSGRCCATCLHFGDRTVGEVAVTRGDIVSVPSTVSFEGLIAAFAEAEHSRLPVTGENLDEVIGMIHIKDVFKAQEDPSRPRSIEGLLRTPLFVPESMGVLDLLARMRTERDPSGHRRRRVRRHRGPGHDRGRRRGDRRRDRGRA